MKNFLFILAIFLISCNQDKRTKEEIAADNIEQLVKERSEPYILNDYNTIDLYVLMARDSTLSDETRNKYLDKLKIEYVGYVNWASIHDLNSVKFKYSLELTKERIRNKWRAYVSGAK